MKPLLTCVLLLLPGAAWAQQPAITFTFNNPALIPPHYSIKAHEDGTGHYRSEPAGGQAGAEPLDREVQIPASLRKQIFAVAHKNHLFATECDSGRNNVAFTGKKTLSYAGPDGQGSCSFNYAKNQQVGELADELIAVATTLEEGRKLELLLAHDKLGLNAEVDALTSEQEGGRAIALQNISPVLQAIAADPEVLDHTRKRAQALLAVQEK